MRPPDRLDIERGSSVVRDGTLWRAEIHVRAGRWRTVSQATADEPGSAAAAALSMAWLGILDARVGGSPRRRVVAGPLFATERSESE